MTTVLEAPPQRRASTTWPSMSIVAVAIGWITTVLWLDADSALWVQRGLGIVTWCVLVAVLSRESSLVRVQTGVVVVFASVVEYTFSPLLEVYVYRFDNVPMYVPPGHGLVYLAALAIGRTAVVRVRDKLATVLVLAAGGGYAAYGVTFADRPDVLGAFWFGCLAGFLLWGPSRGLYIGAFLVVTYLEIVGTALGTWTWQTHDPTGLVSIGNPPSGAAGGYGWFDLAALLAAPPLLELARRFSPRGPAADPVDSGAGGVR
ncbi:MAG: hypothetical protein H0U28_03890 [Nocardioidaceae bacterium]|nr:hypothetical protein [Nocardioidaceae bacterium]